MCNRSCGFTLIELVAVIVLVGIVGTVIMSRFADPGPYERSILRDQIIATARAAQHKALGHRQVTFTLQPQGSGLLLTLTSTEGLLQTVEVPLHNTALQGDVDSPDSCTVAGAPITELSPFELHYALPGNLVSAGTVPVSAQVRICLNGTPDLSVCIAATGFAYAGDCEP